MKVKVIIKPKEEVPHVAGKNIAAKLRQMGFPEVKEVIIAKELTLNLLGTEPDTLYTRVKRMCDALLSDSYTEEYEIQILE